MAAFMISYDLITPGKDYKELHDAIKALGAWWNCLESTWIVVSNSTAGQLRDMLSAHIDNNDKILVVQLSGNWASIGLDDECNNWLKANVGA